MFRQRREAFNRVLKVEYVHRHTFRTRTEARIGIATWITDLYIARRLHSARGFTSPVDYERDYRAPSPRDWLHRSSPRCEGIDHGAVPAGRTRSTTATRRCQCGRADRAP
ncbi:IS3 family transposase [Streptomyces sp. NPDC048438]|uniref:IS3 family transposase n=1 Tax=Streptomyces sp. NPDC048438 TaxID=3365551 RepID=UPI0037175A51